jgi:hypothetical protein
VLDLWLADSQYDDLLLWRRWGYALQIQAASSVPYRSLLKAVANCYVLGSSWDNVAAVMSVLYGIPLTISDNETVEAIFTDASGLQIVTSQNVYTFPASANVLVSVGGVVNQGDPLTDALTFFVPEQGSAPGWLSALTIGTGFLVGSFSGPLTFDNTAVPLQVTYDGSGNTKVSFELGGSPTDVTNFWDDVHANGLASGKTLAEYMDTRTNKTGQPGPLNLPSTVNPLEFLFQNVFRYNVFIARMRQPASLGGDLASLSSEVLRLVTPPHKACITVND